MLLAVSLVLTGLPGAAAALFAAASGVRQVPVLLAIGLAASGAIGLLGFWSFYAGPVVGESFGFFVAFGSALLVGWSCYERRHRPRSAARLATPLGLWALGSAFLLFLGFVHGGTDDPMTTARPASPTRCPPTADIPSSSSNGSSTTATTAAPPIYPGEWLVSDRPPLQIGYVLPSGPSAGTQAGLGYQVLGVILQQLWIVGLWALLVAARVSRVTRGLAMVTVLVSDLAIVNGFYVWPKLLPAAMLLAAAALVMTPLWARSAAQPLGGGPGRGALRARDDGPRLEHLRDRSRWRSSPPTAACRAGVGSGSRAGVGIVVMAPWSAYQKFADPPGNRLTKWTLAGAIEVDERGTREAIRDAYGEEGVGGALHNKAENFVTMRRRPDGADALETAVRNGTVDGVVRELRTVGFFYLLPSMGLLLLAPFAMAGQTPARGHPEEWSFALTPSPSSRSAPSSGGCSSSAARLADGPPPGSFRSRCSASRGRSPACGPSCRGSRSTTSRSPRCSAWPSTCPRSIRRGSSYSPTIAVVAAPSPRVLWR